MVAFIYFRRSIRFMLPLALIVSFSRVYNGVHYPSDVLAGAVLGAGCGCAVVCVLNGLWQWAGAKWFPLWWEQFPSLVPVARPATCDPEDAELPPHSGPLPKTGTLELKKSSPSPQPSTAIELRDGRADGLLSPTLSSRGGEGEKPGNPAQISPNSMAVHPGPVPHRNDSVGESSPFPRPNAFPTPPRFRCPSRDERSALCGPPRRGRSVGRS